ncbi:MAG TPA: hypothetical protein DCQ26_06305 [Marinilabiliales bacterium]|nr:MAG: hypothetical protein A2W95_04045 [Bacteroidetes bacterium GWA2_40_14]OFX58505.1 MAG: hypothetical protein A2W84_08720 [Bacteroidetes bacterium GWC2_40_13]OFX74127.1 MAG: hypothetical protein A2W96_12530 [Bacteroidetes bacterium GWD2_40_43]OFX93039.1 MAG: hypothetical protein A2W97_05545 [Bacteroidetes bacterium GWE2_40_63]OFY21409.1 MAG: hypothetical protein A2W88_09545 [Bacteroidetes bacterium GWF2_40_13]OFZ27403.1 MAG: hypothetical protein A2437_14020 [Bacteroidetes bacterium RIFOXYC
MDELKPLDIAHRFIRRLHCESTGTRGELARHLGITPAWVNTYKNKIEELYKVNIQYCRKRETYFVSEDDRKKLPPPYLE